MRASSRKHSNDPRARDTRSLVGLIATGVLLGGVACVMLRTAGEWLDPATADAQASATKPAATAKVSPTATNKPAPSTSANTPATSKPASVSKSAPTGAVTKNVAVAPAVRPGTAAVGPLPGSGVNSGVKPSGAMAPSAIVQSSAHLDEQLTYQYNALGRRDPFQSLLNGEYVGADVGGDGPPDIGGIKVVGIVWGDADQFALVEDARGDSHILRRGDKVMNGFVEALKRDAMVVTLTLDGQSQSVSIPLTRKGDKTNANR
jgi:hypothetical protein